MIGVLGALGGAWLAAGSDAPTGPVAPIDLDRVIADGGPATTTTDPGPPVTEVPPPTGAPDDAADAGHDARNDARNDVGADDPTTLLPRAPRSA